MVDRALLFEQLMATFIDELGERVRAINEDLLVLEKNNSIEEQTEALVRLFRSAHSIKGASRAVEQLPLEKLCHEFEEVLACIRDHKIDSSADMFSVLFSVVDAIEGAGMQLREGNTLDTDALDVLMGDLRRVVSGGDPELELAGKSEPTTATEPKKPTASAGKNKPAEKGKSGAKSKPSEKGKPVEKSKAAAKSESDGRVKSSEPAPPSPKPAGKQTESGGRERKALPGTVRVAEEKLDSLLSQAGELLVARQRVEGRPHDLDVIADLVSAWRTEWQSVERTLRLLVEQPAGDPLLRRSARMTERVTNAIVRNGQNLLYLETQLDHFKRDLVDDARQLGQASQSIQEDVHRIRMFPISEACAGLERTVRDLARSTGKQVQLIIEGGDIEMDRAVLESLGDPLLHLVRNAVDHGIESPEQRQAEQKNPVGTVTVSASLRGSQVDIVVGDDGAGLNLDRIREKVRELQLPAPEDDQQLIRSIFLSGFSTASKVTDVSGRGVGMDVVKSQVEALHGTIDVSSQPGAGTRFSLSVPLTLTTLSALFVRVGNQTVAVPSSCVQKLTRFRRDDVHSTRGRDVLSLGGAPILVDSLARTMGMTSAIPQGSGNCMLGVVIQSGSEQVVFLVDEVLHEGEVVIKKLGPRIRRLRFVSGGVLLRSGGVALLLNAPELIKAANGEEKLAASVQAIASNIKGPVPRRKLLVVDDSMTTRSLLKSILQSAGHEVIIAVDGKNAWEKLQREQVEMVVTDIDMPIMDGFSLTQQIRDSERFHDLPVVLVTSRDSDEDKARGVDVGADAYVVKSAFDQTHILETIDQLL